MLFHNETMNSNNSVTHGTLLVQIALIHIRTHCLQHSKRPVRNVGRRISTCTTSWHPGSTMSGARFATKNTGVFARISFYMFDWVNLSILSAGYFMTRLAVGVFAIGSPFVGVKFG